jgi:diguanylate cyclase (GGDEF)-like protein
MSLYPRPATPTAMGRGKVLVVDDILANRELLRQALEEEGFEVVLAASGPECLTLAATDHPEVILLDIRMAGMDGIETCRRLKDDVNTAHIPVLFLTAERSDDAVTVEALRAGGNDFLTKPYSHPILIARVSSQVAISRAHAQVRHQAISDELTGLYSRRFMMDSLRRTIKGLSRAGGDIGCLLADVDHFKAINDTRGHLEGDRVLRQVARAITDHVRETDLVARFGGEEFVVLLPYTDLAGAMIVGEKVRAAVAELCAPVTISIGAVSLTSSAVDTVLDRDGIEGLISKLLKLADQAAYAAKHAGRNRVVASPS